MKTNTNDTEMQRAISQTAPDLSVKSGSVHIKGDQIANMSLSLSNQSAIELQRSASGSKHLAKSSNKSHLLKEAKGSGGTYESRE
jgi:hypothetical protein